MRNEKLVNEKEKTSQGIFDWFNSELQKKMAAAGIPQEIEIDTADLKFKTPDGHKVSIQYQNMFSSLSMSVINPLGGGWRRGGYSIENGHIVLDEFDQKYADEFFDLVKTIDSEPEVIITLKL